MLGLMYLGAAALYLAVVYVAMRWAWRAGRAGGGSWVKASGYAFAGFLVVYLPVFWNHIPVLLIQRARCAEDAGFTVFVTAEQWGRRNREVLQTLRGTDLDKTTVSRVLPSGFSRYEFFGGLLARETRTNVERRLGMQFTRSESRLVDARTGELLTLRIGYAVGPRDDVRFWLTGHSCPIEPERGIHPSVKYAVELKEQVK